MRDAAKSAAKKLGYHDLKPEQLAVVETFVKGRDVFAVLPKGYDKSLYFACLPIVFDKLLDTGGEDSSIIVVVDSIDSNHEGPNEWLVWLHQTSECLVVV